MSIHGPVFLVAAILACPALAEQPLPNTASGFKAEMVLAYPDIDAPAALCVASNGDLYFAEEPLDKSGTTPRLSNRIWRLKGGDARKRTAVVEALPTITGMELVGDKLYVVHGRAVSVFTLDADGKIKSRKDLFTDLGTPLTNEEDPREHTTGGVRMGMDGWLYVAVGDKGIAKMTRKETDQGSVHVAEGHERRSKEGNNLSLEGGGIMRFRPDGSKLEVFASGLRNPRDVPMDEQDRILASDGGDGAAWNARLLYVTNGSFHGYPWAFKQRPQELVPAIREYGAASCAGGWVYADDGLPATYRGRVFQCHPDQGKITATKLAVDGAGFKFVDEITFLDGSDVKGFRPLALRPTADGRGFYVLDARRLWKVTYTNSDVTPQRRGKDTDSIADLIKSLGHPAHSERLRAQRALIAKGLAANDMLLQLFQEQKLSSAARRHALWVLRETDAPEWMHAATLESRTEDDPVIYNAIRVLGTLDQAATDAKQSFLLAGELITILRLDSDQANRQQAATAMDQVATAKWCRDIVQDADQQTDDLVREAMIRTLKRRADWSVLAKTLPLNGFNRWDERSRDLLFKAVAGEYDLGAVTILQKIASRTEGAHRQRALELLRRVELERKPYGGGWWGKRPDPTKPPTREIEWAGTPLVREALEKTKKD
jgi:glucose/arabinose dehydrogenase